jgi:hypothetical protein
MPKLSAEYFLHHIINCCVDDKKTVVVNDICHLNLHMEELCPRNQNSP